MRRSEEGALLRKKQEQWAKEKEERAADSWFPFGSPGGGNPNKKHVARDYEVKSPKPFAAFAENVPPQVPQDPSTSTGERRQDTVADKGRTTVSTGEETTTMSYTPSTTAYPTVPAAAAVPYMQHPMMYAPMGGAAAAAASSGRLQQPYEYMQQYYPMPYPAYHPAMYGSGVPPTEGGASGAAGCPPFPTAPYAAAPGAPHPHLIPIHVLPAGTIPIPVGVPGGVNQISSSSSNSDKWVGEWTNPYSMEMSRGGGGGGMVVEEVMEETGATVVDGPASIQLQQQLHVSTSAMQPVQQLHQRDVPHAYVSPFVAAAAAASAASSAHPTASDERSENEHDVYKAQILERRRMEAEEEERRRREEERIERERREKEEGRRKEDEKRKEEERKREEDRERAAAAVLEAMERAKKEAELLKKLRLHRHAMEAEGGEGEGLRMEGVDEGRVERMKREVDAFSRQKRLEQEEIARNAPPKEKKRGMSLSRTSSGISASYDNKPAPAARPAAAAAAPSQQPFRRAASLAPASAAARRAQQQAAAAAAEAAWPARSPAPPAAPAAAAAAANSRPTSSSSATSPFARDAKNRYSLRGTPSPQGVTSRYAHLNQPQARPAPSPTATSAGRSPSVGRPPMPPQRQQREMNYGMPSRNSPLSRTFHAGDRSGRQQGVKSSGYGIGGDWLFSPSGSRSATPDRLGYNYETPEVRQQERGRAEQRRYREEPSFDDGRSSPRSNDTFVTSPTVTASTTTRVEEPLIRYSEYGRGRAATETDYGRTRSMSRPASRQEEPDEYGRRSQIPVPMPRTRVNTTPVTSATNALFSPISTRARKMRISSTGKENGTASGTTPTYRRENSMESSMTSNDSGASSGSEGERRGDEGLRTITEKERVVPAIRVDSSEELDGAPVKMFTPRFSSRPSTPDRMGAGLGGRVHYSERLREYGVGRNADRLKESLTPTVQPRPSTLDGLSGPGSLSASLRNLRMSINNLNAAGLASGNTSSAESSVSSAVDGSSSRGAAAAAASTQSAAASPLLSAADSPGLTRFHSRTSQYRSFNTKRGTDRQQQLLDRLVSLRSRLQDTQSFKDRPLSRQGSTLSISGAGASRLAMSP